MSTDTGDGEDETGIAWTEDWSEANREAAKDVEQKCGISLIPGGTDE